MRGETFLLIRAMGKPWENKSVNNILARPQKTDGKHRCLVISTMGKPWEKTSHTKQRFQTNQIQVTFIFSTFIKNSPVDFFKTMGNSCPESPRQLLAVAPIQPFGNNLSTNVVLLVGIGQWDRNRYKHLSKSY